MFRFFIVLLVIGFAVLLVRKEPDERTRFQEAAIARLSETSTKAQRKAVSIKTGFSKATKKIKDKSSEAIAEQFDVKKFETLMAKFDRVWDKRRAALYEKMHLSREQYLEIESARRELVKEREQIFSKYGFENPTEKQMNFFNEKLVESERYYDAEVESLIGEANFKTLKDELETFNKWLETKSPTKVVFISDW